VPFEFIFDYEWDILTAAPLEQIYPGKYDNRTVALCAVTPFTEEIEESWFWSSSSYYRPRLLEFLGYMAEKFNLMSLQYASLGPGPLFSRSFVDEFSWTEDVDLINSEIAFPAYAQALGVPCD